MSVHEPADTAPSAAELGTAVEAVAASLMQSGQTLATAESCTGGWISKLLTDRPGSSDWFLGGIVSYSNSAKQSLLGVAAELLAAHGAVSEAVACAMAEGARAALAGDRAVAVTGVAGPGGGSAERPVGLVWIAWAGPEGTRAAQFRFAGTREAVRRRAALAALQGLTAADCPT